jgi:hypothetical protein
MDFIKRYSRLIDKLVHIQVRRPHVRGVVAADYYGRLLSFDENNAILEIDNHGTEWVVPLLNGGFVTEMHEIESRKKS